MVLIKNVEVTKKTTHTLNLTKNKIQKNKITKTKIKTKIKTK